MTECILLSLWKCERLVPGADSEIAENIVTVNSESAFVKASGSSLLGKKKKKFTASVLNCFWWSVLCLYRYR